MLMLHSTWEDAAFFGGNLLTWRDFAIVLRTGGNDWWVEFLVFFFFSSHIHLGMS